jgi:hypothetical protein
MHEPGVTKLRRSSLIQACAFSAFAAFAGTAGGAAERAANIDATRAIAMQKHQGYFSEHCVELQAHARLAFDLHSPYPVDFNIHHHSQTATEYPVRQRLDGHYQSALVLPSGGEYCFMWENPESRANDFTIRLHYTVTAG